MQQKIGNKKMEGFCLVENVVSHSKENNTFVVSYYVIVVFVVAEKIK